MKEQALFVTSRLFVRKALTDDATIFWHLWTDPRVMTMVGYPAGMQITRSEVLDRLRDNTGDGFGQLLVAGLLQTKELIGECWLGIVDQDKVTEPDVKLLPEFWGNKYGAELWQELAKYIFEHSDCLIIKATPNVKNIASIKMQESAGAVRVGEGVFHFPPHMQDQTISVHYYEYHLERKIA